MHEACEAHNNLVRKYQREKAFGELDMDKRVILKAGKKK
jgi:hypothetical protein